MHIREVIAFKNYFMDFLDVQSEAVRKKILYVLDIIRGVPFVSEKFLKHIEGSEGIYEIRIEVQSNIFRVFCFFDEGRLVILENGFQKKSQKTPKKEIEKAERIKKEYENEKKKHHNAG
jgi:phage-related protein